MKSGSHPVRVRTNRALARALGVSEAAVRKARRDGRLSEPGAEGWDIATARRVWKANTLAHVGGKRAGAAPDGIASGETEARRLLHKPAGEVLSFADARRARELVKLAREALELRRMEEDTISRAEVDRYVFRIFRGIRDRLDASVSREAPTMAARLGVDEGKVWRELRDFVRRREQDVADAGAARLAGEAPEDDVEVGEPHGD